MSEQEEKPGYYGEDGSEHGGKDSEVYNRQSRNSVEPPPHKEEVQQPQHKQQQAESPVSVETEVEESKGEHQKVETVESGSKDEAPVIPEHHEKQLEIAVSDVQPESQKTGTSEEGPIQTNEPRQESSAFPSNLEEHSHTRTQQHEVVAAVEKNIQKVTNSDVVIQSEAERGHQIEDIEKNIQKRLQQPEEEAVESQKVQSPSQADKQEIHVPATDERKAQHQAQEVLVEPSHQAPTQHQKQNIHIQEQSKEKIPDEHQKITEQAVVKIESKVPQPEPVVEIEPLKHEKQQHIVVQQQLQPVLASVQVEDEEKPLIPKNYHPLQQAPKSKKVERSHPPASSEPQVFPLNAQPRAIPSESKSQQQKPKGEINVPTVSETAMISQPKQGRRETESHLAGRKQGDLSSKPQTHINIDNVGKDRPAQKKGGTGGPLCQCLVM